MFYAALVVGWDFALRLCVLVGFVLVGLLIVYFAL